MKRLLFVAVVLFLASPAAGGIRRPVVRGRVRAEPRSQKIVADNRVTVAPFAVPVAVPVATVSQPTLFYRYGEYVGPPVAAPGPGTTNAAESGPAPAAPHEEAVAAADRAPAPASAATVVTGDDTAIKILTEHCVKCHSGPLAKGGKQFFDAEGRLFARLPRQGIVEMVAPNEAGKQRMPPGELPKLTEDEIHALRVWAKLPRDALY